MIFFCSGDVCHVLFESCHRTREKKNILMNEAHSLYISCSTVSSELKLSQSSFQKFSLVLNVSIFAEKDRHFIDEGSKAGIENST